jgi:cobalamin biosynthesis Mg chelatase CobN
MRKFRRPVLGFALVAFALALVAAVPATAARAAESASVPCWKRLLNDWYDGRIDKIYPIPCYSVAIKHLPAETEIYGSAKEDILAARQAALSKQSAPPEKVSPTTATSQASTSQASTSQASTSQAPPQTTTTTETTTTNGTTTTTTALVIVSNPPSTTPKNKGGISGALADITPGDPQAFPLPLLILGALAILLVIAGAIGMIWQRSHPRDEPPPA